MMAKLIFKNKKGFHIVELMVVILIIAILAAIVFPAILRVRQYVNEFFAARGLMTLSAALEMYKIDYGDYPDSEIFLINANPPYIQSTVIVVATTVNQKAYAGYYFDYTKRGPNSYMYIATPASPGVVGIKQFIVDENGEVTEYIPPSE